jgi:hypothetical protein
MLAPSDLPADCWNPYPNTVTAEIESTIDAALLSAADHKRWPCPVPNPDWEPEAVDFVLRAYRSLGWDTTIATDAIWFSRTARTYSDPRL